MTYQWTITTDRIGPQVGEKSRVGVVGPSNATLDSNAIATHPDAERFRLKDADGEVYYEGFYLGDTTEDMFGPLDDYGAPYAGCVTIEYHIAGQWEVT